MLVVGATGSIGRLVVAEAVRQGHAVLALVRNASRARGLPRQARRVVGDLTRPQTLSAAVEGVDATRHAGDPSDGVIARRQIAEVLVSSQTPDAARGKTFELVAERGPAAASLEPLFAALDADLAGVLDAARDATNMPRPMSHHMCAETWQGPRKAPAGDCGRR